MSKRAWLGVSAGSVLLLAASGGAYLYHRSGDPAAVSDAGLESQGQQPEDPAEAASPQPPKPIPLPESELHRPGTFQASPAHFETPEASTESGDRNSANPRPATTGRDAGGGGSSPPSNQFMPFGPPSGDPPPKPRPWNSAGAVSVAVNDREPAAPEQPPTDPTPAAGSPGLAAPAAGESAPPFLPQSPVSPDASPAPPKPESAPTTHPEAEPATLSPPSGIPPAPNFGETKNPTAASGAPAKADAANPPAAAVPAVTSPLPALPPAAAEQPAGPARLAQDLGGAPRAATPVDTPGPPELEGTQTPTLLVEKTAPEEIQVGIPATFKTFVRNTGQTTAHNVVVTDRVPQKTRLLKTAPQCSQTPTGELAWQLGSLSPGEEIAITIELMPEAEGEIGSVAQATFQTQASVRTRCTRAQLAVTHKGPAKVLIGEPIAFEIEISNPGTGAATGVVLEEDVPPGLVHPEGRELEHAVGTLAPGETRRLQLVVSAEKAGAVNNAVRVRGDGQLTAEHRVQLEVIAPQLQVALVGPGLRYLERQATYDISVTNPGTAVAKDIDLVTHLPKGLKFIAADQQGRYDKQSHAVYWSLAELAPKQQGVVQLTALPIESGQQKIRVEGQADMGLSHQFEHTTVVEGVTGLQFTVSDLQDPIEVGAVTVYEVRLANSGTKAATNVLIGAVFPAGLVPAEGEGPTRVTVQGQQVAIEPLAQLAPGAEAVYRIQARGQQAGEHVVRVQSASDDNKTPVTKEEGTRVYADQ